MEKRLQVQVRSLSSSSSSRRVAPPCDGAASSATCYFSCLVLKAGAVSLVFVTFCRRAPLHGEAGPWRVCLR